ncbi:MAG: SAF domain-containing protein [Acidimicrobiales bacterium]
MSLLTTRSNGAARHSGRSEPAVGDDLTARNLANPGRDVPGGGQRRKVDVPQVLVAVLLVAGCALGALVWSAASNERVPVLALAADVARGEELSAADVRVVNLDTDTEIASVPASSLGNFVGSIATADLTAGTVIAPSQFAIGEPLGPGEAVVGAALDDGEYPVPDLRPGDRVDAYLMPASTASASTTGTDGGDVPGPAGTAGLEPDEPLPTGDVLDVRLLAAGVEVYSVTVGTNDVFVSLRAPSELAGDIAGAADLGRLRLVLVADPGAR